MTKWDNALINPHSNKSPHNQTYYAHKKGGIGEWGGRGERGSGRRGRGKRGDRGGRGLV